MPLGLSQEHAKSGLDRANSSHGRKRVTRFQMEATMATGTVKFFNAQKGYGFIVQDAGGSDAFGHGSAVGRARTRRPSAAACPALTRGRSPPLTSKPTAAAASPPRRICKRSNRSL